MSELYLNAIRNAQQQAQEVERRIQTTTTALATPNPADRARLKEAIINLENKSYFEGLFWQFLGISPP